MHGSDTGGAGGREGKRRPSQGRGGGEGSKKRAHSFEESQHCGRGRGGKSCAVNHERARRAAGHEPLAHASAGRSQTKGLTALAQEAPEW